MAFNLESIQSRRRVYGALAIFAASSGLSTWLIIGYATETIGYLAFAPTLLAAGLCIVFFTIGLVLLVFRKTRFYGLISAASGMWLFVSYLGVVNFLYYKTDLVVWKNEKMQRAAWPPEQGEGIFVYFRPGTTNEEIENFTNEVLERRTGRENGDLSSPVSSYGRLMPAAGMEVLGISFRPGASDTQRSELRSRIKAHKTVFSITDSASPPAQ